MMLFKLTNSMPGRRPGVLLPALAVFVLVLAASAPASADRPELLDVPEPDLSGLEASVREALTEVRREFEMVRKQAQSDEALGDAYGEIGAWYQAHGLIDEARLAYRNARRLAPGSFEWPYLLGSTYEETGDFGEAVVHYGAALERNPGFIPALVRRGRLHLERGEIDAAESDLRAALNWDPEVAAAHAALGQVLLERGADAEAVERLETALQLDPNATALYGPLAVALRNLGEVEKARQAVERRGDREPGLHDPVAASLIQLSQSPQQYFELGMGYGQSGDPRSAARLIARAIELDPDNAAYLRGYAEQLFNGGEPERAREALLRARELEPDFAAVHVNLGVVEYRLGDQDAAVNSFRRAVELGMDDFQTLDLLGRALMRGGEFAAAAGQYAELAGQASGEDRVYALYWSGMSHIAAGRCAPSQQALEQAWQASEQSHGWAVVALVRVLAACEGVDPARREQALEWAEQAYEVNPGLETSAALAMIYAAHGRFDDAVDLQAQAIFEALRANALDDRPELSRNMQHYQAGEPAPRAFDPADPLLRRSD